MNEVDVCDLNPVWIWHVRNLWNKNSTEYLLFSNCCFPPFRQLNGHEIRSRLIICSTAVCNCAVKSTVLKKKQQFKKHDREGQEELKRPKFLQLSGECVEVFYRVQHQKKLMLHQIFISSMTSSRPRMWEGILVRLYCIKVKLSNIFTSL